jgi:glycosyltransferase involved in cell wall biosynthesis
MTKLNIVDTNQNDPDEFSMKGPSADGTYTEAQGGTELMNKALYERVDKDLLDQFHIIKSRVRSISNSKKNILWLHDTWDDPESQHLKDKASRERFAKLVFVSNYQLQTYNLALGVPYHESFVLRNAINPIPFKEKRTDQVKLIYHTTPHRGLNIAYAAIDELSKIHGDKIHFDVYSSFEAYGWKERDEPYLELFDSIRIHPHMTYHGFQPNNKVRDALREAHIYAYPNIWPETSCISVIEAMSAACQVVCPNYAALPETTGNFATMYQWSEDVNFHANVFVNMLNAAIQNHFTDDMQRKMLFQKNWTDNFYNWELRSAEWTGFLQGLLK